MSFHVTVIRTNERIDENCPREHDVFKSNAIAYSLHVAYKTVFCFLFFAFKSISAVEIIIYQNMNSKLFDWQWSDVFENDNIFRDIIKNAPLY